MLLNSQSFLSTEKQYAVEEVGRYELEEENFQMMNDGTLCNVAIGIPR